MRLIGTSCPLLLLLLLLLLQLNSASAADAWSYNATHGPAQWPNIEPKWCSGRRQSPIALSVTKSSYDSNLVPHQIIFDSSRNDSFMLMNPGTGLNMILNSSISVRMGGNSNSCYRAHSMHWHWGSMSFRGSEHWLEGRQYPMEGHIVMWDCRLHSKFEDAFDAIDGLAVLGVLYEESTAPTVGPGGMSILSAIKNNSELIQCQANCPGGVHNASSVPIPAFSITDLMPKDLTSFFMYYGSLTTPDCRENVLWTVYRETLKVPAELLNQFRMMKDTSGKSVSDNYRILQELNPRLPMGASRMLTRSFGAATPNPLPTAGAAVRAVAGTVLAAAAFVLALSR